MEGSVRVSGDDEVNKLLKKLKAPYKTFDKDVRGAMLSGERSLKIDTPVRTGDTARKWTTKKNGFSNYLVSNNGRSFSNSYNIVRILDEGHGVITPKKSKRLYIPLNKKGSYKLPGGKIPKDFVFGIDYVLAKKVKAVKGLGFIKKTTDKTSEELKRSILKRIDTL